MNAGQDGDVRPCAIDALVEGATTSQRLRDPARSCAAEAEAAGAVGVGGQSARRALLGGFEALFDDGELDFESVGKGLVYYGKVMLGEGIRTYDSLP